MSNEYVVTTPVSMERLVLAIQEEGGLVPYSVEPLAGYLESTSVDLHVKCDETLAQLGQERDAARLRSQELTRTLAKALGLMHDILLDADDESVRDDSRVAELMTLGMAGFAKHIQITARLSGEVTVEFPQAALHVDEEKLKRVIRDALDNLTVGQDIEERIFRDRHDPYDADELGDIEIDGSITVDRIS